MYAGTVWLGRREEELMRMTPRKFCALLKVHYDILKARNGDSGNTKPNTYIDDIPGW